MYMLIHVVKHYTCTLYICTAEAAGQELLHSFGLIQKVYLLVTAVWPVKHSPHQTLTHICLINVIAQCNLIARVKLIYIIQYMAWKLLTGARCVVMLAMLSFM